MGPRTHAAWLCSLVFDGARAFEGVTPDLDLHCARVNDSAKKLYLKPLVSTEEWIKLAHEGIARFDSDVPLYIRPMYWAEKESPWIQSHDPESTRWCLSIYEAPMRPPKGFSMTMSPFRRPTLETMPVDAKAGCLYPNNARCLFEAQSRGYDNAAVCDMVGNVAELATFEPLYGEGWRGSYTDPQRDFPGGDHASARRWAAARQRRNGDRAIAYLSRLSGSRRNLLDR